MYCSTCLSIGETNEMTCHCLQTDRDYLIGRPVREYFGNDLGVYQVFDDVVAMDGRKQTLKTPIILLPVAPVIIGRHFAGVTDTIDAMNDVETSNGAWSSAMTTLETELTSQRTSLNQNTHMLHADCQALSDCLALYNEIPDLTTDADPSLVCTCTCILFSPCIS